MQTSEKPLVSIVIACYNHEDFVQASIQSVIDQTYDNIELIIIDDGSKDGSVAKIESLLDQCKQRFTCFEFKSRPNKGLSATLNEALEWCQGEYFSAFASDDIMLKNKTTKQVEILNKRTDVVGVFGAVQIINAQGCLLNEIRQPDKVYEFKDLIYTDSFLPAPTQLLRLAALRKTGGYIEGMLIEDWYIYLKILEDGGKILYTDELYCYYRIHGGNTYSNPYSMGLGYLQVLNEFEEHEEFKRAYIKACWENSLATLRLDFKLSTSILIKRISHKFGILSKKVLRSNIK